MYFTDAQIWINKTLQKARDDSHFCPFRFLIWKIRIWLGKNVFGMHWATRQFFAAFLTCSNSWRRKGTCLLVPWWQLCLCGTGGWGKRDIQHLVASEGKGRGGERTGAVEGVGSLSGGALTVTLSVPVVREDGWLAGWKNPQQVNISKQLVFLSLCLVANEMQGTLEAVVLKTMSCNVRALPWVI